MISYEALTTNPLDSELIYANAEVHKIIKRKYPAARFEDASDFIHTERFEVHLPKDVIAGDFYRFAIREGFATCCFGFQLGIMCNEKFSKEMLAYAKGLDYPKKNES